MYFFNIKISHTLYIEAMDMWFYLLFIQNMTTTQKSWMLAELSQVTSKDLKTKSVKSNL